MEIYKKYFTRLYTELGFISLLLLIFIQLVSDLVESVYIQCLLTGSLDENILPVLFFLSPIVLLFFRKGKNISDKGTIIIGEIMVVCRVMEALLITQAKAILSGLGIGCFLIYFSLLFLRNDQGNEEQSGLNMGIGLAIALSLSIFFRTLGSSLDISTYGWFQWIGWLIAFLAAIMIIEHPKRSVKSSTVLNDKLKYVSKKKIMGLTFGLIGIFILIYFVFSSPTVMARWTEMNYLAIIIILVLIIATFTIIASYKPEILNRMNRKTILIWNGLFVLSLVLTIALNQVIFPESAESYPLLIPETNIMQQIPLLALLVLSPIVFIDFTLFSRELIKSKPTIRTLGGSFALASLFFLLLIFANVFTAVWDYIDVIGRMFRDMYWFVFMIAGLAAAIPTLLVMKSTLIFKKSIFNPKIKTIIATIIALICLGTIIGSLFVESYPEIQTGDKNSVKILTYNIQQGVNRAGIKNFEDQLWVLKEVDADIIGLQETDTARIAGGNSDVVRFFANNLKLYSYYGPKDVTSTFGIALLSKYPIKNAKTFYMYSFKEWEHTREQTACIEAEITIGTKTFTVFVTHLGNAGPISEQQEILTRVKEKSNVILMGDFNFKIDTPQYALTTKVLVECWEVAKSTRVGPLPTNTYPIPEGRIDHIFVSPTLKENVAYCEFLGGSISDHPACYAVLKF